MIATGGGHVVDEIDIFGSHLSEHLACGCLALIRIEVGIHAEDDKADAVEDSCIAQVGGIDAHHAEFSHFNGFILAATRGCNLWKGEVDEDVCRVERITATTDWHAERRRRGVGERGAPRANGAPDV